MVSIEFEGFETLFDRYLHEMGPSVDWDKIKLLPEGAVSLFSTDVLGLFLPWLCCALYIILMLTVLTSSFGNHHFTFYLETLQERSDIH